MTVRHRRPSRNRTLSAIGLTVGIAVPQFALAADHPVPHLTIVLEPAAANSDGVIRDLKVTIRAEGESVKAGVAVLRMPVVTGNVVTAADALEGLSVDDRRGPIPLTVKDDSQTSMRRWIAGRAVEGPFIVHYHLTITNRTNPLGGAPPYELRSDGRAFSGALNAFAPLPDTDEPQRVSLNWNVSALGEGAVGLSSFGIGDVDSREATPVEKLNHAFFMGGQPGRYPKQPNPQGFFGAYQGTPPFDAPALLEWTEGLYGHYSQFFRSRDAAPFGVFLRPHPAGVSGNVQLLNSFVGTFDARTNPEAFKRILAHEMVHAFVGGLDRLGDSASQSWYSEGLAEFYSRALLLRFGQTSPDDYIHMWNSAAARYYTSAVIHTPNTDIDRLFWRDARVGFIPYDRGSLYFARVDEEVRKATNGAKSLDDLVHVMLDRRVHGLPADLPTWRALLRHYLGQSGIEEFEAMLSGDVVEPASDAFGPCFTRISAPLRPYELGFEPKVLNEPDRTIRGLIPGSAAEKAGLRSGDRILAPVSQVEARADNNALLTLKIGRGTDVTTITYLPRGEAISAYQWVRTPGSAGASCAR